MLVLSRKLDESIIIETSHGPIEVRVVRLSGDTVRLGIEAPRDVPVNRQEIYEIIQRERRRKP